MKKIFYLFLLGILFLMPKNVFASLVDNSWLRNEWQQYLSQSSGNYIYGNDWQLKIEGKISRGTMPNSPYSINVSLCTSNNNVPNVNAVVKPSYMSYSYNLTNIPCVSKQTFNDNIVTNKGHIVNFTINVSFEDIESDYTYGFTFNWSDSYSWYDNFIVFSGTSIEVQQLITQNNITSQNNITNEKLDDINDTMNNSDIDTDGANSFFGNFSDTDHGGISGVVTAPLQFINKLTGTCSPISLNVLGSNVELPCGDTLFWNKPEVANFRIIWNLLVGGPILYLLLSKLFNVIESLKNPDDSRIEVMKL